MPWPGTVDSSRFNWPWRDWVIKAFNDNMPFDQFTIEQLAGDQLPNPTQSQLIELASVEKVYRMGKVDYRALRGVDLSIAAADLSAAKRVNFYSLSSSCQALFEIFVSRFA